MPTRPLPAVVTIQTLLICLPLGLLMSQLFYKQLPHLAGPFLMAHFIVSPVPSSPFYPLFFLTEREQEMERGRESERGRKGEG